MEGSRKLDEEGLGLLEAPPLATASVPGAIPLSSDLIDTDLGWQEFLRTVGVSATIISYVRDCGDVGRQAFVVGFDNARSDLRLVRSLISYAEQAWRWSGSSTFWPFHVSREALELPAHDGAPRPANAAAAYLQEHFGHAAVARHGERGAKFQALLFRDRDDGDFTPACREAIERVLPLLMQSAGACVAARRAQRKTAQLEAMFDKVSLSTLLVDAEARPIFCNDAARAMLQERSWLLQSPDGTIACRNAAQSKQLKLAIREAAAMGDFASAERVLRLDSEQGEWRLAFIVPAVSRLQDESSRCAMVLVHAPARAGASAQLLSALGLLPSEQRFLNSFLRARSLSEAASETGVSDETARTYLKRVRAKLGVHRQMELAGLISGLVPPIRAANPGTA